MPSFYSRLTGSSSAAPSYEPTPTTTHMTQDEELEAAFSDPGDDDALVRRSDDDATPGPSSRQHDSVPGSYDFEGNPFDEDRRRGGGGGMEEGVGLAARARSFRERFLPSSLYNPLSTQDGHEPTSHSLPDAHLPLPSRGPPAPPRPDPAAAHGVRPSVGGGNNNDGVFANLSAKPDAVLRPNGQNGELEIVGGDDEDGRRKDEVLPSYDAAALDAAPPYWETTVTLPGGTYGVFGPDDVLVEGLPVGNLFGFAWNLLVSMSFQFVGFLLTYLLHTTHAAKNGSRAGLGITLIQYGLYLRTRASELAHMTPEDLVNGGNSTATTVISAGDVLSSDSPPSRDGSDSPWGLFGSTGSGRHDWDGSSSVVDDGGLRGNGTGGLGPMYDGAVTAEQLHMSSVANEWLSYVLMIVGWFLVLGGALNYWRAVRWARAVRGEAAQGGTTA